MARPLLSAVYSAIRQFSGDPSDQVLHDAVLQPYVQVAYAELFRALQSAQNPRTRQESYYDLPAYTSVLDPATAGITSLGELESIEERGGVTEAAITGATPGAAALTVTAVAHPFATSDQIVQFGIGGLTIDSNGIFSITKTSANAYTANGCTATGTYTSGGTATKSAESFTELHPQGRINFINSSPQSILQVYAWEGDLIHFPPCSALRQLRITYSLSGDAPTATTATIPIDDSKDFLSFRACGLALQARGNRDKASVFNEQAVGPDWGKGIPGGILEQLLSSGVRNLQRLPPSQRQPPPWRRRRR